MIARPSPFPAQATAPAPARNFDQKRLWFAFALPGVMAFLLALVPVIGTAAAAPILLVLVSLILWSAFRDTERALYVYIAWCWMDGTIRGLFSQAPASIVARDIALGMIVVGWGMQRLYTRHQNPLRYPPGSLLIALFVVNCLIQVFSPFSLGLLQSIGGLKLHLSALPLFFVTYDVIRRRDQVRALFLFLTLATLVVGAVSFVQYTQGQDWTWAHFPGTKEVISQSRRAMEEGTKLTEIASFKPPGTTGFGGGTAIFPGLVFPLTFALLMLSQGRGAGKLPRGCLLGVLLAFVIIILINSVRAALVMAVAGVLFSSLLIGGPLRKRMLAAVAVCLVLGMVGWSYSSAVSGGGVADRFGSTLASPTDSLHQDRRTFFDDAGFIVTHSPLGVGLGRTGAAAGRLGSGGKSNLDFDVFSEAYLGSIIYETGILGGALICAICLFFLARGYAALHRLTEPDDRFLVTAIVSVLAVIFCSFFVAPILTGPPGSVLFWMLGATLLRVFPAPGPASALGRRR